MGNGEPFVPLPPEKYFIGKASHIDILFTIQLHVPIVLDLFGQSQIVLLGRMCNPLPQFLELLSVFFQAELVMEKRHIFTEHCLNVFSVL